MIVVAGGGLAGLVAAHELTRAGAAVTLLEKGSRLGGQIWTERHHGFLIEHGAEGYAAGRASPAELASELVITDRLVSQLTYSSLLLRDGRLVSLPTREAARLAGIQADSTDFGQGIGSLMGGMGELVDALAAEVARGAAIRLDTPAVGLTPQPYGWQITTGGGGALRADAVILALPPAAAARLVAPISRDAAAALVLFRAVSSVSISLAWRAGDVRHPPEAGGFVSGAGPEAEGFRACSFASARFPGRAAEGHVVLRAFFRPGREFPMEAPDARWVEWAVDAVRPVLSPGGQPVRAWVARWPEALPRYGSDHDQRVRSVTRLLGSGAPLVLVGAAYQASGIAGAIESARVGARSLLAAQARA